MSGRVPFAMILWSQLSSRKPFERAALSLAISVFCCSIWKYEVFFVRRTVLFVRYVDLYVSTIVVVTFSRFWSFDVALSKVFKRKNFTKLNTKFRVFSPEKKEKRTNFKAKKYRIYEVYRSIWLRNHQRIWHQWIFIFCLYVGVLFRIFVVFGFVWLSRFS